MKELGNLLRDAREQKGISLEEISKHTKIQEKYLKSMEDGDFTPFAGQVYVKGALKNYAEAIGLDVGEVVKIYDESIKQTEMIADKKERRIRVEENKPRYTSKEKKPFPMAAFVWVFLLALIVSGSLWYRHQQASDPERAVPYNNDFIGNGNDEYPGIDENNGRENENDFFPSEPDTELEQEHSKALILVSQDGQEHIYSLKNVTQKEIRIEFTSRCWVQVMQDNQKLQEKNFNPGEVINIGDGEKTRIRLGYPAGARILVNELEVESINDIHSPVYVVIQKESFQF